MPLINPTLKANFEKFDSEFGELRTSDMGCVSIGMAFWKVTERSAYWSSPYTKRDTGVNEPTTAASLCLVSQEECMPRTQCGFRCCHSTTVQISPQQIFEKTWEHAKDTCFVDLPESILPGSSWKVLWVLWKYGVDGCLLLACRRSWITTVPLWCWAPTMVCAVTTPLSISRLAGQIRPVKPFHPAAITFCQ